ncbi:unnamed protein product [Closterium sp. Naga37s-1]|nr:unnamed protein product [Closterium sp. Naga37s-1]
MRRDVVRRFATESGKFPPRMVLIKACRWVRTSALVIAASRRCSNVIPDGPAPIPFSHLPNILAKSARGIESVDPRGVGHATSSCSAATGLGRAAGVSPVPASGVPVAPRAAVPGAHAPASALSPKAASTTTGGPSPSVAPLAPAVMPVAPAGQSSRPPSPDRRSSRPHSLALHQGRASSWRRRDSLGRYHQQPHWPAHSGGHGGWRGPCGRGGGGAYRPPVIMADLQREVSRAVREERAAQSQSNLLRAAPAHVAPRQAVLPVNLPLASALPPPVLAPSAPAPAASAAAPGSRLRLPPVPSVAGVEFVAAGGGAAGGQHTPYLAADEPLPFLAVALQPPQTRVPEATLGQLHRLA